MRRRAYYGKNPVEVHKGNLDAAFKQLRKEGFFARQSFMCCGSCGMAKAAVEIKAGVAAGKLTPAGVVFYHKQDAEDLKEGRDLYLSFSRGPTDNPANFLTTAEVGQRIVAVLNKHGVETEWDGSPATRILAKFASLKAAEPAAKPEAPPADPVVAKLAGEFPGLADALKAARKDPASDPKLAALLAFADRQEAAGK